MNGEVVNLAAVAAARCCWVAVMAVRAADREDYGAISKPSRLTLNSREAAPVVDDEVVSRVLPERRENRVASLLQKEHRRKRCAVPDRLRMFHSSQCRQLIG